MASNTYYGNGSSANCTNIDYLMKRYYLPVMYGIIFVVGVLGNVTSLLVYLVKVRPWKSSSIILVNLATTDLLYMLSMPFLIYYYAQSDSWTLGDFMCRFVRFGFHFNLYGSILFLTCLAVFRYVAVVHPLQAAKIQKKRWGLLACVLTWTLAAAQMAPIFSMIFTVKENNITSCLDLASNKPTHVWWWRCSCKGTFTLNDAEAAHGFGVGRVAKDGRRCGWPGCPDLTGRALAVCGVLPGMGWAWDTTL
ncbi:hypothetical protein SRHO_G00186060 [Serrasalmus rhombeus]